MAFQPHDVVPDSPINNFPTMLSPEGGGNRPVINNGGLEVNTGDYEAAFSTISFPHNANNENFGKWYFEIFLDADNSNFAGMFSGIKDTENKSYGAYYHNNYYKADNTGSSGHTSGRTYVTTEGAVHNFLIDFDNKKFWYGSNGNWNSSESLTDFGADMLQRTYRVFISDGGGTWYTQQIVNFGQDPSFGGRVSPSSGGHPDASGFGRFFFDPLSKESEALALCTKNLPSGPINLANDDTPEDYFKAVTYTGDTASVRVIETGFQPDLVWVKQRNMSLNHALQDSVRGPSRMLASDGHSTEYIGGTYGQLTKFESNGFEVTNGSDINYYYNQPNQTYVAWVWKAAGSPADNQALIVDTNGSLTTKSTSDLKTETGASITPAKVSANRKSGFSIVKYNGTGNHTHSFPHGLTNVPDFVIIKLLGSNGWIVKHSSIASNNQLTLNSHDGQSPNYGAGGIADLTSPNVVNFYHEAGSTNVNNVNASGTDYIAYCWHSVAGYSKFSSYIGNGSTTGDGPYVELGFRPAWLMVKEFTQSGNHWGIFDSARDPYNGVGRYLYANLSSEEDNYSSSYPIDFLSNGFKIKTHIGNVNNPNQTYLFAAFAEYPMNAPSNAR